MKINDLNLKITIPFFNKYSNIENIYGQSDNKKNKFFLKCDDDFLTLIIDSRKKISKMIKIFKFIKKNNFEYVPTILWKGKKGNVLVTSFPSNGNGKSLEEISNSKLEINLNIEDEIFDLIKKLHNIKVPTKYKFRNYNEIIKKEIIGYLRFFKKNKIFNKSDCQKVLEIMLCLKEYFKKVKISYIHDDLTGKNICYDFKEQKIYFIDWDTLKIGDPNIDLAKTITHKFSPIMDKLICKHYPDLNPRIVNFYSIRVSLYWVKFLYKTKNPKLEKALQNLKKKIYDFPII